MGDDFKILRFDWRNKVIDMRVEVDKCTLLDIVVDYEDEAKKQGMRLDYHFPVFSYCYNMEHQVLVADKDLMTMFQRLSGKEMIKIWVGTCLKPNPLYKLVLNLRRKNEGTQKGVSENVVEGEDDLPQLDDLEDTSVAPVRPKPKQKPKTKPQPKPKPQPKLKPKPKNRGQSSNVNLPPAQLKKINEIHKND